MLGRRCIACWLGRRDYRARRRRGWSGALSRGGLIRGEERRLGVGVVGWEVRGLRLGMWRMDDGGRVVGVEAVWCWVGNWGGDR